MRQVRRLLLPGDRPNVVDYVPHFVFGEGTAERFHWRAGDSVSDESIEIVVAVQRYVNDQVGRRGAEGQRYGTVA